MANFISIPVTSATAYIAGNRLIGVNGVNAIVATGTAAVKLHCGLTDDVTLTTSAGGAVAVINAITAALSLMPGGNILQVDLPAGVTVTNITVA
jgi:hypothetical protein